MQLRDLGYGILVDYVEAVAGSIPEAADAA